MEHLVPAAASAPAPGAAHRRRPADVRARLRVDVDGERCCYWIEIDAADGHLCRLDLATARHLVVEVEDKLRMAERMAAEQSRTPVGP
ncbi:MAG TPA: hypothetical protein VIL36_17185 [Acidimicrobiales bacterium]